MAALAAVGSETLAPLLAAAASRVQPHLRHLQPHVAVARAVVERTLQQAGDVVDSRLAGVPPSRIVLCVALAVAALCALYGELARRARAVRRAGLRACVFDTLRALPVIRTIAAREKAKVVAKLKEGAAGDGEPRLSALPPAGLPAAEVLALAERYAARDVTWAAGESRMSGAVYMAGAAHEQLLCDVYARFRHSNPLHADAFPASARMEREVVAMVAALLGGGGEGSFVCGCLTSGGTESILTALRATRDWQAAARGVREPEMICAVSAHAAVDKAASYFGIRLVRVPVDPVTLGADVRAVARALTRNTVLIYASAPGFPHGVIDDVPALAALARRARCGLHVDCCLGGFWLPFARRLGHPVPPFDFAVPGVTSMSVDTHKYGLAQKGSSVLLYASRELRRFQYTAVTDWSGGLYVSPSQAGSRSGALVAQTWAALVHTGAAGYEAAAARVLAAARELAAGVDAIPGLRVLGRHAVTMVVAWRSADAALNIYQVNDALKARGGWHLNALQRPPALHMCVTAANAGAVRALLADLAAAVADVRAAGPGGRKGGMAPVYGLAGGLPDRGAVGEVLKGAQDVLLDCA